MDALPPAFSVITPYFWPLYSQLFGISHVLLWQFLKIKFRGYFVGGSIILYYMRTHAWDSKMCELCELCEQLTNMPTWDNCKYATPLCFYRVNCIFFGFRAFWSFFIQFLAVILHRNRRRWLRYRKSLPGSETLSAPHLLLSPFEHSSLGTPTETHRTFIALSSRYHRTHIHV